MRITENMKNCTARALMTVVLLTAPVIMLWAQETNKKYALTTQMFLNELKAQAKQPMGTRRHTPARRFNGKLKSEQRLIARPDTVGGVAYISCFIHLKDAGNLSAVRSLGVEVEETFDGLDFVTARVPVKELEALADIDNVTKIKVARRMRLLTDEARKKTNVDDLLTQSPDALALGVNSKYDGSGVILGVIDTGIDFQHIAFKDKDGNSRIKRGYIYKSSGTEYTESNISSATTDDSTEDHGTHTASTAGGSSVIVSGNNVTVTDDHANATYGGMAPGADLYLAGVKNLNDTGLTNALKKMVSYADAQGKPLVVSNSWGSGWGPRDGTGEWADLVGQYFGDSHPNRVILFAASNDAGHKTGNEGGGFFVKKSSASSTNPLGTIIRTDGEGGYYYVGLMACAWATSKLNCKLHVLDGSGTIKKTWTVTKDNTSTFSGLSTYYTGSMTVYIEQNNGKYMLAVYSEYGMENESEDEDYTLAIEVYPESGSANINMWSGDYTYFTDHLTTSGHTWTEGTDDMCVSDEATIPDAISIGAYVSKKNWKASNGSSYTSNAYTLGDIAYFSSYATAENSPTGLAYPWITAPGARLAAGVNHYHTASLDYDYSYYGNNSTDLVVNNSNYPYAMMEGTSMATPVAAGIVALWLQAASESGIDLTVNDVKEIMETTAINDTYTTTGANASHFGKGKIDALAGIQYILGSTPKPATPTIIADPTTLTFVAKADEQKSRTFDILSELLTDDVSVTLTDANNVFSIDKTTITKAESEEGATVTVSFRSATAGTYTGEVTLSSEGAEPVTISLKGSVSTSNPDTKNFKLVTSTDDLEPGMRYIIACGSKATAAGALSSSYLSKKDVTITSDVITIGSDVAVFVLEETDKGWTFLNESTNKYLQCTAAKSVSYSSSEYAWTLNNGTAGVIMKAGSYGTMLYNANDPRFTTYTSDPNASMIQANLYMETNTVPKKDVTMAFDPTEATATIGKAFTEPTLTTDPANLTVTYESSDPAVATVDENTGEVTLVAAGETTITATFAGDNSYNEGSASYTLTVKDNPAVGALLYEGVTGYSTAVDGTQELKKDNINLDYDNWATISKVYAGGTSNAYSNGGCLKFGTGSAKGSMKTGDISLTDDATLTFYLKKYGSDTGKLNVTVTGAKADVSQFTPQSDWTLCTVKLSEVTGTITITLATSANRAYVDEIILTPNFIKGDANGDGKVTITDAVAIVNYILGNPSPDFNIEAANVNNDTGNDGKPSITITDAVGVVNIILNSGGSSASKLDMDKPEQMTEPE